MALSIEQFLSHLTTSELLLHDDARVLIAALPEDQRPQDGEALARELVKQKKLTKFQAEQLCAGKGKSLTLGNYIILDKLGQGGMGMMLKARHRRMKWLVALKVMNSNAVKDPESLNRFHREVEAAAKLTHPNIVAAHDADEAKGTHFLVMEYIEGSDLSVLVKKHGPLPFEQAVQCIIQAARGLEFAHKQGVIHRDIKPANLVLDNEGTVKILDMGLARIEDAVGGGSDGAGLTSTETGMGTVDCMSPEQALNTKHADARSDIYSLGISLYYLLTGKVVFDGDTFMKKRLAHRESPIPSLVADAASVRAKVGSSDASSVGHALDTVFRHMVAKRPEDRQQTMTQVIAELERCLAGGSSTIVFAKTADTTNSGLSAACSNELQQFLRQISGKESMAATIVTPSGSKVTTMVPSSREAETMISSAGEARTDPRTSQSLTIEQSERLRLSKGTTRQGKKSRTAILISVAAVVVMLLGFVFAVRDKSGTLYLEITDDLTEVTIGDTDRTLKGKSEGKFRLPLGKYVLHVKRNDLAFDTDMFEVTNTEPVSIKVERIGRRVHVTLLGHQELPNSQTGTAVTNRRPSPQNADRRAAEWVLSIGGKIKIKENGPERNAISDLPRGEFELTFLHFGRNATVNDAGLAHIKDCKSLTGVDLSYTPVSDVGLAQFKDCKNLTELRLDGTQVSDAGLVDLAAFAKLVAVNVAKTKVTETGVQKLSVALPRCQIEWEGGVIEPLSADPDRRAAEWVLSIGSTIKIKENDQERPAGAVGDLPQGAFELTVVDLNNNRKVSDAGLAHFKDCKNLTNLVLAATQASDVGLAYFKDCKNLTNLNLADTPVSDAGLIHFKDCKNLSVLLLSSTQVNDAGLAHFKDCKNLTGVDLSYTPVSDVGLAYFKDCEHLTEFRLDGTQVSDAGLADLAGFANLVAVKVAKTKVTETGVQKLSVALPRCQIEWEGGVIEPLSADPDRRAAEWVLSIGSTIKIKENDQERPAGAVGDLPQGAFELTVVDLNNNRKVSDAGLAHFKDCKNLTSLYLYQTPVSNAGLVHFKDCKNLTFLQLASTQVSDAGLVHFKDCKNLTGLMLHSTQVSDAGLAYLKDCKNLMRLGLTDTQVSDAGLAHFKDCKNLSVLLLGSTQVSDAGLADLTGGPKLVYLQLKNTKVTEAGVKKLSVAWPECLIEWDGMPCK